MDAEQRQAYIESEGVRCPYCGSEDIAGGIIQSAKFYDGYEIVVRCNNCGKAWKDIYTLTDVEALEA